MPVCGNDVKVRKGPVCHKVQEECCRQRELRTSGGETLACAAQARWARRRVGRNDGKTRLAHARPIRRWSRFWVLSEV